MGEVTNWQLYLTKLRETDGEGLEGVEAELWRDLVGQEVALTQLRKKAKALEDELAQTQTKMQRTAGAGMYLAEKLVDKAKKRYAEDPDTTPGPGKHQILTKPKEAEDGAAEG